MAKILGATSLTGSGGSLDSIDGAILQDQDACIVITDTNTYFYKLFDNQNDAENSPYIIVPDTNPGNKRWKLTTISEANGDFRVLGDLFTDSIQFGSELVITDGTDVLMSFNPSTNKVTFANAFNISDSTMVQNLNANFLGGSTSSAFMKKDGSTPFTSAVAGQAPTEDAHLATKAYVDTYSGTGNIKSDGSVSFSAPIGGQDPIDSSDLSTKNYVDGEILGVMSYVDSVGIDVALAESYATSAANSAMGMSSYVTSASDQATLALGYANSAESYATSAANSAMEASDYIDTFETYVTSASAFAENSLTYATSAANSANLAAYYASLTTSMMLSAAPIDHAYSGITVAKMVGENITSGQVCYLKSDGKLWKAKADAEITAGSSMILLATSDISTGNVGTFLIKGYFRDDSVYNMTIGKPQYISAETAGAITETAPSTATNIVKIVGYAETADIIFFCPDANWLEV